MEQAYTTTANKSELVVVKIGGNIIDDAPALEVFLKQFAAVTGKKILVHGGGKLATRLAEKLGTTQHLVDGRRVTDAETLKIVTMVYAGFINKNIVARLQSYHCNAVGLTGADGGMISAHKRLPQSAVGKPGIDYGFVGDVDSIGTGILSCLLNQNFSIVIAPLTHDNMGQLLNTNADTIAQELAKALSTLYKVRLVYSFEKSGVLRDAEDESTVISTLNQKLYTELKEQKVIFAGMIPKLDNAFIALNSGVETVIIGHAVELDNLLNGHAGTTITHG